MKTVCSPWGIVSYEFPNQGLMDIKGGFDNIVLDVGGIVGYHAYHNLHWRKKRGDRSYRQWVMDHPAEVYERKCLGWRKEAHRKAPPKAGAEKSAVE